MLADWLVISDGYDDVLEGLILWEVTYATLSF